MDHRFVKWPLDIDDIVNANHYQLLEWYRFLPSPENEKQIVLINRIYDRVINGN